MKVNVHNVKHPRKIYTKESSTIIASTLLACVGEKLNKLTIFMTNLISPICESVEVLKFE